MQHQLGFFARSRADLRIGDVAFDEAMSRPVLLADRTTHVVEIALVASREVVETRHRLASAQQRLEQVRADEAGRARDEPAARAFGERAQQLVDRAAHSRHTLTPRVRNAAASAVHFTST